jgi:hypothetical protein
VDWQLALWTGTNWMFSGGILYLVYRFGYNYAQESGLRVKSWRSIALLLGFLVAVAMFGTDYPDEGLLVAFDNEDRARFAGVFAIVIVTYVLGFVDGRTSDRCTAESIHENRSAAA